MTTGIDNAIGRFLEVLEKKGLADNTIIVYTADNGFHMGNRGFAGKWSHYEESLRVPMVVYDPRSPKSARGQVLEHSVLNPIYLPPFWIGRGFHSGKLSGRSFKSLRTAAKPTTGGPIPFTSTLPSVAAFSFEGFNDRFKHVITDEGNYEFLHDLKNDPDELVNLAKDSKHAKTLAKMRKATDRRVKRVGWSPLPQERPVECFHAPASQVRRHRGEPSGGRRFFEPARG